MIVSANPNRVRSFGLMACVLLCGMAVHPAGVTVAQDMPAVTARLKAAGDKIGAAAEVGKLSPEQAIAKWHEIKEKIITGAIAGDEISEKEADALRVELVKAEARQLAKPADSPAAGRFTAEQVQSQMDRNGDGKISKEEASEELRAYFESMDTNNDGVIDAKEAQVVANLQSQLAQGRVTAEFYIDWMDKNGDGKISKDEATDEVKPHFAAMDTNGDGALDVKEAQVMADFTNQLLEKYFKVPQVASSKPVPAAGRVTAAQIVGYMDKNNDDNISRGEASADLKPHFDQIDANKDGVIDVKEAQVMADYVNSQQAGSKGPAPE